MPAQPRLAPALLLLSHLCLPLSAADPRTSLREWQIYHGDYGGSHYSELNQINRTNLSRLKVAWTWSAGEAGNTIECNPIVINGIIYLTTPRIHCVALNAKTGKPLWRFDPWDGARGGGVNRGVSYWSDQTNDHRIFHSAGNFLHALDSKTGNPIPSFGTNGRISLRDGFDQDVFFLSVGNNTPGMVWNDLIIMGSTTGEGPGQTAPGHIRAFNVRTGEREWIFHTIPHPAEFGYDTWSPESWKKVGSANVWAGFTLDAQRGIVFAGTGSAAYDHWGGDRIGDNLFANSTLALDASTGKRLWHFQSVHHDLWDYDLPTPPVLCRLQREGKTIDAVAQPTKMGFVHILDRVTGKPLFPIEEIPVPQSTMPGEHSSPTQPFPANPNFRLAQIRMTPDNVTGLNPAATASVLKDLENMVTGDVFIPPGHRRSVTLPQFNGGCEWGGAAFDPEHNRVIVNVSNEAEWISMVPARPKENITLNELGRHIYRAVCSHCHGLASPVNPASPSLKDIDQRLTRTQILDLLKTGRGQMPSFASFTGLENHALLAFLFKEGNNEAIAVNELKLSWAEQVPVVATGHHDWRDPEGFPVNKRPWGTLNAIDLNEGKLLWQVPLGTYPKLEARGVPPTGTFNIGGPLVTAGGIVFIGATMDERFHAYDKDTGKLLWQYQLSAGGYASPATYEIDGRQYIVIAAGGGGKPGTKPGDTFYAFALE